MNALRLGVLFGALVVVALSLVVIRTAQTGAAAHTLRAQYRMIQLRREFWHVQAGAARLRAPTKLHERLEWFDTGLVPPEPDRAVVAQDGRFVIYRSSTNRPTNF